MKKCMQTDKPLVSIVLALYNPNKKWLIELLDSLNNQYYENVEILIYDDCSEKPFDINFLKGFLSNFPVFFFRGTQNKGSNYAFEFLTAKANGKYIAYCDQDDIWEYNKIDLMVNSFKTPKISLVYSDLCVISENGSLIHESFSSLSKRHIPREGGNLFQTLIVRNYVVGCAMMIRSDIAKKAIPFENDFVHDHYLVLCASLEGELVYINDKLVNYRIHTSNQTGVLNGVFSKRDYFDIRIKPFLSRTKSLYNRFPQERELLSKLLLWGEARFNYYEKKSLKSFSTIIKYKHFGIGVTLFEILLPFIPNVAFDFLIKNIKKGRI